MNIRDENQNDVESSAGEPAEDSQLEGKPRKRRRRKWLLFVALPFLLLIALAPNLLGLSGQLGPLVNRFVPLNGSVQIESASLGWIQSLRLEGVRLQNTDGDVILKADRIESAKSLLNIVLNRDQPGAFTIDGAEVALITWPGGSNLETVLQPVTQSDDSNSNQEEAESSRTRLPELTVKLTNSRVSARKQESPQWLHLSDLNADIQIEDNNARDGSGIQFTIEAKSIRDGSDASGSLSASGTIEMSADPDRPLENADIQLTANQFSPAITAPILHRIDQDLDIEGAVDASMKLNLSGVDQIHFAIESLRANNLDVVAHQQGEAFPVQLRQIDASGELKVAENRFSAKAFQVKSDFANLTFDGDFDPAEILAAATSGRKIENDFAMSGTIDLAMLTRLAPQFLDVRDDIELDDATINFDAFSREEAAQRRLFVNVELPRFRGRQFEVIERGDNRRIDRNQATNIGWPKPLRLTVAARQSDASLWLELVTCESDFLSARGSTAPDGRGQLTLASDLKLLRYRLGQFFDLADLRLTGILEGKFDWEQLTSQQFEQMKTDNGIETQDSRMPVLSISGGCVVRDFIYRQATDQAMREEELVLKIGINHATSEQSSRLESAAFEILTGVDRVRATLARPVPKPDLNSNYLVDVQVDGDLQTWVRRAKAFVELPRVNTRGRASLTGRLDYGPEKMAFKSSDVSATDVLISMQSMKILEPKIEAEVDVLYNVAQQRLTGRRLTAKTDASAVGCEGLTMDFSGEKQSVQSHLALILNLQEVMGWVNRKQQQNPYRGRMLGSADLSIEGPIINLTLDTKVEKFAYLSFNDSTQPNRQQVQRNVPESSVIWAEDMVAVTGEARYNTRNDALGLKSAAISAEGIAVDLKGRIEKLTTVCELNIAGTLKTDSALMVQRLQENIGIDLQMAGIDTSNLYVKGPLFSPEGAENAAATEQLNARLQFRWDGGKIYGLPFGQGRVAMLYDPKQLDIAPIQIALDKGRIDVDPAVLFGDQMMLTLQSGKIVNRANLSPELCRSWLKFVAPMIAEATHAEGTFSVDLNENVAIPLSDPLGGTMDATVSMHQADVGPGPLGEQMITVAKQIRSIVKGQAGLDALLGAVPQDGSNQRIWIRMPEQKVNCRVQDGRVYHDRMIFEIGDLLVQTTGSVGADQSMEMEAVIPIPAEWLEKSKLARSVAGDTKFVKIPIRGTVNKPKLGTDGLVSLSKELLRGAARNYLKDKAGKFLEDSAGKLLEENVSDLLKRPDQSDPRGDANPQGDSLKEAAEGLLEEQLRKGFGKFFK